MAIPSISTKSVGDKVTAAWAGEIKDTVDYLKSPPRCFAYDGTGIACANGTATLLTFDSEVWDDYSTGMHSTSSNTSRINILESGKYLVTAFVKFPAATYTQLDLMLRRNAAGASGGGTLIYTQAAVTGPTARFALELSIGSGAYYELFVTQSSGASRTTVTDIHNTGMSFRWIGT